MVQPRDSIRTRHLQTTLAPAPSTKETESVKFAFLKGVEWGCGKVNATHSADLIAEKNKKATAAGLGEADKIILNQLDAAKLAVMAFQKTETRRLEQYHSQGRSLLLEDVDDDEMEDEDDGVVMEDVEPITPMQDDDEIMYEDESELGV